MTPAGGEGQLQVQEFLDGISDLDFNTKTRDWYTVDVSTMIQDIDIIDHEIDDVTRLLSSILTKQRHTLLSRISAYQALS